MLQLKHCIDLKRYEDTVVSPASFLFIDFFFKKIKLYYVLTKIPFLFNRFIPSCLSFLRYALLLLKLICILILFFSLTEVSSPSSFFFCLRFNYFSFSHLKVFPLSFSFLCFNFQRIYFFILIICLSLLHYSLRCPLNFLNCESIKMTLVFYYRVKCVELTVRE